jgi:YidC/Oxa1 family membrane protein insertase
VLDIFGAPVGAAYHLVSALALFLAPMSGGLATAAAIVLFTIAVRLLLTPLSYYAFRGQARMSAVQPKVAELSTRWAGQPERLQAELAALYRREAGGMLAGCLPLLLQLPFFSIMYRLFLSRTVDGRPNVLLSRDLLTTPLGSHWLTGSGPVSGQGLLFLCLFGLLAAVAFVTARASRAAATAASAASAAVAGASDVAAGADSAGGAAGAAAGTAGAAGGAAGAAGATPAGPLGALGRLLPYTTVVIAAFVPLAAGLYLLTSTAWTAAERVILRRGADRRDEQPPQQTH